MAVAPPQEQPAPSRADLAADRIRETAKWLIVAFAAVGSALLAGSQLSDLGSLEPGSARFVSALIGAVAALGGVLVAIAGVASVLVDPPVGLRALTLGDGDLIDIRKTLELDDVLVPEGDLAQLRRDLIDARRRQRETYKDYLNAPSTQTQVAAQLADGQTRVRAAEVANVIQVGQLLALQRAFKSARRRVFIATAVAAAGILTFAAASNPARRPAAPATIRVHGAAVLTLTTAGRELVRAQGGRRCGRRHNVVVLGIFGSGAEVVTLPRPRCRPVRLTVSRRVGSISAR